MRSLLNIFITSMALILIIGLMAMARADTMTPTGRLGGAEVYSAKILPKSSWSLGYEEEYFQNKSILFNQKNDFHGSRIFITTSPFKHLQLFLNRRTYLNNNIKLFSALNSVTYSKSELGATLSKAMSKHHFLALEPTYVLFNANKIKFFKASSFAIRALYTYETLFGEEKSPLRLNSNIQYFANEGRHLLDQFDFSNHGQKDLYGISRYYSVSYGLGLEIELDHFTPYLEYSLDQMLRAKIPFFDNPNRLSTGVKFRPFDPNWVLHVGSNFGFAYDRHEHVSSTPNFSFFTGLSYVPKSKAPVYPIVSIEKKAEEEKTTYPIYPIEREQTPKNIDDTPEKTKNTNIEGEPLQKPVIRKANPKQKRSNPREKIEKLEKRFNHLDSNLKHERTQTLPAPSVRIAPKNLDGPAQSAAGNDDFYGLSNRNANEESPDKDFLLHFR